MFLLLRASYFLCQEVWKIKKLISRGWKLELDRSTKWKLSFKIEVRHGALRDVKMVQKRKWTGSTSSLKSLLKQWTMVQEASIYGIIFFKFRSFRICVKTFCRVKNDFLVLRQFYLISILHSLDQKFAKSTMCTFFVWISNFKHLSQINLFLNKLFLFTFLVWIIFLEIANKEIWKHEYSSHVLK